MNSFEEVWDKILEQINRDNSFATFELWIRPISFVKYENETLYLSVSDAFKYNIIKAKFSDIIAEASEKVIGQPVKIEIILTEETN